jgi:hypothetical protein
MRINRAELLRVAQHLNVIVVSLDRIGAAHAEAGRSDLAAALLDFLDNWDVFAKLAQVREVVDGALLQTGESEADRRAVEEALDRGPYWPDHGAPGSPRADVGQGVRCSVI